MRMFFFVGFSCFRDNIIRVLQSIGANEGFMGLKMSCWLVFCVNEMIFKIVISRSESRFGRFVEVFDL